MALGVLSAFHQNGVAVPGQKSVIGYDDTYESAFFHPSLSTVSLDLDRQGKEAVERLLRANESDSSRSSSILPARLVVRHSSGAPGEQQQDLKQIADELRAIASRLQGQK
jgi:DNA-binding LacI/PurR family transcriptional regulator